MNGIRYEFILCGLWAIQACRENYLAPTTHHPNSHHHSLFGFLGATWIPSESCIWSQGQVYIGWGTVCGDGCCLTTENASSIARDFLLILHQEVQQGDSLPDSADHFQCLERNIMRQCIFGIINKMALTLDINS
jgi:hypothetical protein